MVQSLRFFILLVILIIGQIASAQLPYVPGDGKPSNIKFTTTSPDGQYNTGSVIRLEAEFDDWLGQGSEMKVRLNTGDTIVMTFDPEYAEDLIDPNWGEPGKRNATLEPGHNNVLAYGVYCILELEGKGSHTENKGKMVLAGGFHNYEETNHDMLVVTDHDGKLLQGFGGYNTSADASTRFNREVRWAIETNDGGLLVCGAFTDYGGNSNYDYIVKFKYNSTTAKFEIDTHFMNNLTVNNTVQTANNVIPQYVDSWGKPQRGVLQDTDGNIYLVGAFTQVSGQTRRSIAKLSAEGVLDNTFNYFSDYSSTGVTTNVSPGTGLTMTFDPDLEKDGANDFWFGAGRYIYRLSKTTGRPTVDVSTTYNTLPAYGQYNVYDRFEGGPNLGTLAITVMPNEDQTDAEGNSGPGGVLVTGRYATTGGWTCVVAIQDDLTLTPRSKFCLGKQSPSDETGVDLFTGWAVDGAAFMKGKMWIGLHEANRGGDGDPNGKNYFEGCLAVLNYDGSMNTKFNRMLANADDTDNTMSDGNTRPDNNYRRDGIGGESGGNGGGGDIISLFVTSENDLMVGGSYGSIMQYTDNAYATSAASSANPDDQIITRINFKRAVGYYTISADDRVSQLKIVEILDENTIQGAFGEPSGPISMENIQQGDEFENNHFVGINMPYVAESDVFITTWETTVANENITIPTTINQIGSSYDFYVDWGTTRDENGDGTPDGVIPVITHHTSASLSSNSANYTYPVAGKYTITITSGGNQTGFPCIYFNNGSEEQDTQKILSVEQWGAGIWKTMDRAFFGCSKLKINASDAPILDNVTNMTYTFAGCSVMNSANLNIWDVSNVTTMSGTFKNASKFNQPIGGSWQVGNVTTMQDMFNGAIAFNQPLGNWDVGKVTNMRALFAHASVFNQNLDAWQVDNVTDMSYMFDNAKAFNGSVGSWNVGKVTTMRTMFQLANSFDGDITAWDVSNVKYMQYMFFRAIAFDHNLGYWEISSLEDAANMLDRSGLDIANYDSTLISWDSQVRAGTASGEVKFSAAELSFCAGAGARDALMRAGWGDGLVGIQNNSGVNSNGSTDDIIDGGSRRPVGTFVFNDDFSVCIGNMAAFNLSGSEVGVYYQLYNKANNLPVGDSIPGTGTSLSFTVSLTDTTTYYAVATNYTTGACETRLSDEITITVDQISRGGTLSVNTTNVCSGDNVVKLYLNDDYYGDIIRWESSIDSFSTNIVEIEHTEPTYVVSDLTVTTDYRAVIQSGSCDEAYSEVVTVVVVPLSVGGSINSDVEAVCRGNNYTVLRLNDYVGDVVRWQVSHDNFTSWSSYAVTVDSLEVQNITQTTYYRAQIQSGACTMAYSDTITLTVDPMSVGGFIFPSDTAIYSGEQLNLKLIGETGSILRWESSTDNFETTTEIDNRDNRYLTPVVNDSIYYRALVQSGVCDSSYSTTTLIYVLHSDYGDAPDSYGTIRASNGPEHRSISTNSNIYIGSKAPDFEINGQPSSDAGLGGSSGDDGDSINDEDGLGFSFATDRSNIILESIPVVNNTSEIGYLYGWIDINQDGIFDNGERAMKSIVANSSAKHSLSFTGFNFQIEPDNYFVRLRVGSEEAEISQPTGLASDGEVEDHIICIRPDMILLNDARIDICRNTGIIALSHCINYEPQVGKTIEWTTRENIPIASGTIDTGDLHLANLQQYNYKVTEEYCNGRQVFGEGKVLLKVLDDISLEDKLIKVCYDDAMHINLFNYLGYIGSGTWSYISEESTHASIDADALEGHIFDASMSYSGNGTESFVFEYTPSSEECVTGSVKVTINVVSDF